MPGRIAQFLCNTSRCHWQQNSNKKLYLCRHGQSEYNSMKRIGGDAGLTEHGEAFAFELADYCENEICVDKTKGEMVKSME
jgi:6-phosphofructo-2-kinase / fructose-2,6-biphosphatase 2